MLTNETLNIPIVVKTETSLLNFVYRDLNLFDYYAKEQPAKLWFGVPGMGMATTTTLAGLCYCLVTDRNLEKHVLHVNREKVAEGRLEILNWTLENAFNTYKRSVQLRLAYEGLLTMDEFHLVIIGRTGDHPGTDIYLLGPGTKREAISTAEKEFRKRNNLPTNVALISKVVQSGTEDICQAMADNLSALIMADIENKEPNGT